MAVKAVLPDKSVLSRLENPSVAAALLPFAGRLATCGTVLLEMGWSATSPDHFRQMREEVGWCQRLEIHQPTIDLACDLQAELVDRGHHRGPGIADLILAATAITHSAVLVHYDRDFELIAEVDERLEQQWVVPRGTID